MNVNTIKSIGIIAGGAAAAGAATWALGKSSDSKNVRIAVPVAAAALGGGLAIAGAIARSRGVGGAVAGALQLSGAAIAAGGIVGGLVGAAMHEDPPSHTYDGSGVDGSYDQPNPDEGWDAQDPTGPEHPTNYTPKAGDLLPNIVPQEPSQLGVTTSSDGTKKLLFGTTTGNLGKGPLELRRDASGTKPIMQVVHNADGTTRELATDRDTFEDGQGTNHLAFNDFARYSLYRANADGSRGAELLRSQYKESFLIIDTTSIDTTIDPERKQKVNRSQPGYEVQGVSPGWGDTYGAGLCGQSFDITGLADGQYVLRQAMDPGNRFAESNEKDNVRETTIDIEGGTVTIVKTALVDSKET